MGLRDDIGKIRRTAPKVGDAKLQRAIDTIYKDLNKVADGTNSPSGLSAKQTSLGTSGDIKLYKGAGLNGKPGYFLQARFADGWATTRLTLEAKNPEATEVIGSSQGDAQDGGPEPYITKYGVTYENLQFNQDVAGIIGDEVLDGLVARGNHKHNHWVLQDPGAEHLNDIHFPLVQADVSTTITNAGAVASNTGLLAVAARADHVHKIDTAADYVDDFAWTGVNQFGDSYGVNGTTVNIYGPTQGSGLALHVEGDVEIDGNLNVFYSETQSSAVDLENDVKLNTGNLDTSGNQLEDYENKTIVHGPTKFEAGVSFKRDSIGDNYSYHYDNSDCVQNTPPVIIEENSASGQLRLAYDSDSYLDLKVDNSGSLIFEAIGNIELKPLSDNSIGGAVIPKGNLASDLGMDTRKWRSIHAGELVIDHLVAQNVVSTIGGKIMVAPTTEIAEDLDHGTTDYIYLKHNDPNFRNAYVLLEKWTGVASQVESIRIKDVAPIEIVANEKYKYEIHTRNANDDGAANNWVVGDAVACLYALGAGSNKGFIELTATGSVFSSSGPRISMYAAQVGDNTWDAADPMFSVGKLKGHAGYTGDDDFGLALGDDLEKPILEMKGLTVDRTSGLKLYNSPLNIYDNGTKKVEINKDGTFRLGSSLKPDEVETKDDWDNDGSNVGLKWDGDTLYISGVISAWGDILQSELDDLTAADATLEDLINDIENLDSFSNYAAAELLSQEFPGNIFLDSGFEFESNTNDGGTYTDMALWGSFSSTNSVSDWYKAKSPEITPFNGTYVMCGKSIQSAIHDASVVYNTDLQGNKKTYPVVPGMKFSARYRYYIPSSTWVSGPPNGTMQIGLKIFSYDQTKWTWITFASSANATNSWQLAEDTYTIPEAITWYQTTEEGVPLTGIPTYVQPYLVVDEHNNTQNTENSALLCYFDEVYMDMDSSMAMPASPSGDPGFFAGSDAFGIHDGTRWRTYFGLNADGSVMKLTSDSGVDMVTWDNDVFSIGENIKLSSANGDIEIEGNLKIGHEGSIYSNYLGYDQYGIFLGHVKVGQTVYPKMSLRSWYINNDDAVRFKFDTEDEIFLIENCNISGQNVEITLDNIEMDFFVARDVVDQGADSHDDIIIGSWLDQTNSSLAGEGILVKHAENDYSKIYAGDANNLGGFNRRGFDYPILVHDALHWGGPVVGQENYTWDLNVTSTHDANSFQTPLSYGQPGGFSDKFYFPHETYGCKVSHFWNYDFTTVPEGRKLTWIFTPIASHNGNYDGGIGDDSKYRIDLKMNEGPQYENQPESVRSPRGRELTIMHNSNIGYGGGMEDISFGVYPFNSWSYSERHHFGFRNTGCQSDGQTNGHSSKWCFAGFHNNVRFLKDFSDWWNVQNGTTHNTYVSYGEIPAGIDVTDLYVLSAYTTKDLYSYGQLPAPGIMLGNLKIWETNA